LIANNSKTKKKPAPANGFKKGKSGNPSGRPKLPEEFKQLAKDNSTVALQKVIDILKNPNSEPKDVIKASEVVMDRAWGKANQSLDIDAKNDTTLRIILENELEGWAK